MSANDSIVLLDGDSPGHSFRGNQHVSASRESATAGAASRKAKRAERVGDAEAQKKAHRAAYHAHMAAVEDSKGITRKYHETMAKFHGGRSGVRMDDVTVQAMLDGIELKRGWDAATVEKFRRYSDTQLKLAMKDFIDAAELVERLGDKAKADEFRDQTAYVGVEIERRKRGGKEGDAFDPAKGQLALMDGVDASQFKPGDVVLMKVAEGVETYPMTVNAVLDGVVECVWFRPDNGEPSRSKFDPALIRVVVRADGTPVDPAAGLRMDSVVADAATFDAVSAPNSSHDRELKELFLLAKSDWRAAYAKVDEIGSSVLADRIRASFVSYGIKAYAKEKKGLIGLGAAFSILMDEYEKDVLGGVSLSKLNAGQDAVKQAPAILKKIIDTAWGKGSFDYLKFKGSRASLKGEYPAEKTPDWAIVALDAADGVRLDGIDTDGYVGKVYRGSELIGRVDIVGDGKAMIFVGPSGGQRVTEVVMGERTPARYSDADTGDLIGMLLENLAGEQAAQSAPIELPYKFASATAQAMRLFSVAHGGGAPKNAYKTAVRVEESLPNGTVVNWDSVADLPDTGTRLDDVAGLFGADQGGGYVVGEVKTSDGKLVATVTIRGDGAAMFEPSEAYSKSVGGIDPDDDDEGWGSWIDFDMMENMLTELHDAASDMRPPTEQEAEALAAQAERDRKAAEEQDAADAARQALADAARAFGEGKKGFLGVVDNPGKVGASVSALMQRKPAGSFVFQVDRDWKASDATGKAVFGVAMWSRQKLGKSGRSIDPNGKIGNVQVTGLVDAPEQAYLAGTKALTSAGGVVPGAPGEAPPPRYVITAERISGDMKSPGGFALTINGQRKEFVGEEPEDLADRAAELASDRGVPLNDALARLAVEEGWDKRDPIPWTAPVVGTKPDPETEPSALTGLRDIISGKHDSTPLSDLLAKIEELITALGGAEDLTGEPAQVANDAITHWVKLDEKANG